VADLRRAAVGGSWYPGSRAALVAAVERYLREAGSQPPAGTSAGRPGGDTARGLIGLIAPHAGLMYSGPVAAHAYRLVEPGAFDVAVLVGPSHFVGFDGVAVYGAGGFETPLGIARIDADIAADLIRVCPVVRENGVPHSREHSLEMQLPFLQHVAPDVRIVPLLMGYQTAATSEALGAALAVVLSGRRALLVASTDLSHYHDRATAARLDSIVADLVGRLDPEGLQQALDRCPEHACGGGPAVAVMRAAATLGASTGIVLNYADSGDVSGDVSSVVGYLAGALLRRSG
jgi:AmmeMemoRadiSam system protein B